MKLFSLSLISTALIPIPGSRRSSSAGSTLPAAMRGLAGIMTKAVVKKLGIAVAIVAASPAFAQPIPPFTIPAGIACEFQLTLQGLDLGHIQVRDQLGRAGMVITAGKAGALQFINDSTQANLTVPGKGAVSIRVPNGDGTDTLTLTGHWVIVWFPTDNPVGPSTIQYLGRLVINVAPGEIFTLVSLNGQQLTDICAALS